MESNQITGFLLINKKPGLTSFQCIGAVRRILGRTYKIGHTGTLDAFASGLLIIAIARTATRHIQKIMQLDKRYYARAKLGQLTDTLDYTGVLLAAEEGPRCTQEIFEEACASFGSEYAQTPPIFSALKFEGVRLSTLARGEKISKQELETIAKEKTRVVKLYHLELHALEYPYFALHAHVSHGTYIRVLMEDIAQKLQTHATTYELERTAIGPFNLSDAATLDELVTLEDIQARLVSPEKMIAILSNYSR